MNALAPALLRIGLASFLLGATAASAATVDGRAVHWSSAGSGDDAVVLVHGWTCDETFWREQVPALAREYRVLTLDLPGHGRSELPADGAFSADLFARSVEAVRQEAGVARIALVGHSMGVPVVLRYAALYPERATALVLVDGIVELPQGVDPSFVDQFAGPEGMTTREAFVHDMFSAATTPAVRDHILSVMLGTPEETALGAMRGMFAPGGWIPERTDLPVLGIYAPDEDPQNDARAALTRYFPTAAYAEIPETGHFLMMEKPEEFNRLLLDFLARHGR